MPLNQRSKVIDELAFSTSNHAPRTKGARGLCTMPRCDQHPTVSLLWTNPAYPHGWWGSYNEHHANQVRQPAM